MAKKQPKAKKPAKPRPRVVDEQTRQLYLSMDYAFLVGMHVAFTMDRRDAVQRRDKPSIAFIDGRLKLIIEALSAGRAAPGFGFYK